MSGALHGPWNVDEDIRPGMSWNRHIHDARGETVCFMAHSDGKDTDGDVAKANLIAEAPSLYAALAELVECVMGGDLDNGGQGVDSDRHDAALSEARAALSRASGAASKGA